MDPKKTDAVPSGELEGEGNKTADQRYREGASGFARGGQAMDKAREAERDLDRDADELRRAEERGRAPGRGEDLPADLDGSSSS